jgi:DNA repair photolyase
MPAFYPDEIMRHVKSHISLDGLVLWTKNPTPMFPHLEELGDLNVPFYFQYTLNDYDDLEPGIPALDDRINTFISLSQMIGKERVIWRFDPILLTKGIDVDDISAKFRYLADKLHMHTEKVVFSFVDIYPKIADKGITAPDQVEQEYMERVIADTCLKHNLKCATCAETFRIPGIEPNQCIDVDLLNRISGNHLAYTRDSTQRAACGCAKSKDIGEYHTCRHGCLYCYAN